MFKNVASQKLTVLAFADAGHATLDAGEPVTGDATNITCKVEQDDDGIRSAVTDTNPTETEDGQYVFDITAAECNGDKLTFYPQSATAGVQVVALPSSVIYTRPQYFSDFGIGSDGDLLEVNTLTGHTAQTGDSYARLGAPAGASVSADIATVDSKSAGTVFTDAATLVDLVWDEVLTGGTHNVTNSAGKRLRTIDAAFEVHSGTAQAGSTSTTFVMDTGADGVNDNIYRGDRIVITGGTGAGEHGIITSYTASTRTANMAESWVVTPDNTSEFAVVPADVDLETWNHNVVTGDGDWAELQTDVDAILVDTNELQGDWTNGGRLDLLLDALITEIDTATTEPGQGAPGVSEKRGKKIDYLYKWARNKVEQTATTRSHYDDAGTTVDQKSTVSDDGTTFTRGEIATGP